MSISSSMVDKIIMAKLSKAVGLGNVSDGVRFMQSFENRKLNSFSEEELASLKARLDSNTDVDVALTFFKQYAKEQPEMTVAQLVREPGARALLVTLIEKGAGKMEVPLADVMADPESYLASLLVDLA